MKISFARFLLALGVMTLVGCAGAPAQYYTLSQVESRRSSTDSNSQRTTSVKIGAYALSDIGIPAEVDNISLVVSQGDGRLMVLSEDRWTGSLSAQLSTALSQALTQRIGMPPVQKLSSAAAEGSVTKIQLDVQRFDLIPGQFASLDTVWSVRFPDNKTLLTCYTRLQQPVAIGVLALVKGQQENVALLADQMTEALSTRRAPARSSCRG